jgi:hypothetical protein
LLLSAFVVQTFSKPFIVLDYFANTRAYAKNCENKARPAMHCNGKCQMMKKLQQEEKQSKENAERKGNYKIEVLSSRSFYCHVEQATYGQRSVTYNNAGEQKPVNMPREYFHPPAA